MEENKARLEVALLKVIEEETKKPNHRADIEVVLNMASVLVELWKHKELEQRVTDLDNIYQDQFDVEAVTKTIKDVMNRRKEVKEMGKDYLSALEGMSESDWIKLKIAMDRYFSEKHRELQNEMKLSDKKELQRLIHAQFGCELD